MRFEHEKNFIDVSITLFQGDEICASNILFDIFHFFTDLARAEVIQLMRSIVLNGQLFSLIPEPSVN